MKNPFNNLKKRIKKFTDANKDKIEKTKIFFLTILGYGILINYSLFIIWKVPFLWFGFPAFGIAYYFVMEEFVSFFLKLKTRIQT